MKIIVLDSTAKSIKAVLASSVATSNPDFVVAYADTSDNTFSELSSDGQLNGTTDVTLVAAPASGVKRTIKSISVYNRDTAPVIVVIKLDVSGTQRILQRVQLVSGETWHSDDLSKLGPGGSDTQVQFNDTGTLAGSSNFTYNKTTSVLTLGANPVLTAGTANGVLYLNASKVATSGSVLTFDGAQLGVNGITLGRGAGAVATNTAVGASALAANTSGSTNSALGQFALFANTTGYDNTGIGRSAMESNTTGLANATLGRSALYTNTTGSYNTAVGTQALLSNTTASENTAVGYQAGYSNTTGAGVVAIGWGAGYTNTTGSYNTYVGTAAGRLNSTSSGNTFVGIWAGYNTTGGGNTFIGCDTGGFGAGYLVTTGTKNTILGAYNGNEGGLDIRTSSNYIVLSDGDGNPRGTFTSGGWFKVQGDGSYQDIAGLYHEFSSAQNNQAFIVACSNTGSGVVGIRSKLPTGANASARYFLAELAASGTVFQVIANGNVQNTNNSYGAISDVKLKENIVDATPKLASLMQVRVRNYNLIGDTQKQIGVVAQELEQVFPGMIEETADTDSEGNDIGTTTKAVKYSVFVPMLIKAMQELKSELDSVKAELATLKGN